MQEQGHLHAREGREQAFQTATFRRKIPNRSFVPELVPLDKCARHADQEPAVLASDQLDSFPSQALRSGGR